MTFQAIGQLLGIGFYLAAAALLWRRLESMQEDSGKRDLRKPAGILGLIGLLCHGITVAPGLFAANGLALGITAASSLVAAIIIALYLVAYIMKPVANLGLILFPIAALAVFAHLAAPGSTVAVQTTTLAALHIAVSLLAYGFLAIAAAQGALLLFEEHLLKAHQPGGIMRALPPLQAVETLMFQLIVIGFLLLTLTLVSGIFFSEEVFNQPFRFSHHIVLSIGGWVVYAVLLVGRWRLGWRGRVASSWALTAFGLLLLAYFGTKFVSEIILKRTV